NMARTGRSARCRQSPCFPRRRVRTNRKMTETDQIAFTHLGLTPQMLRPATEKGYTNPTPIQAKAIPAVLAGKDIMGGAQTGTGKTAGFTLPLPHRLGSAP